MLWSLHNISRIIRLFLFFSVVFVVCRRGNDSQLVVKVLKKHFSENTKVNVNQIKDIIGGLQSWTNSVDENFPKY
jgi:adenylyltransferase/sulfurtransferase